MRRLLLLSPRLLCLTPCLALCLALWPAAAPAQGQEGLQEVIEAREQQAEQTEEQVRELSGKERTLKRRIKTIEARVAALQKSVREQEQALADIREQQEQARERSTALRGERDATVAELQGLLQALWPVHMQNLESRFQGIDTWQDADRRFTWLADVYGATRRKLEEVQAQTRAIEALIEEQGRLEAEAAAQLASINATKDDLLGDKLELRRALARVSKKRRTLESELGDILATIDELHYRLQAQDTRDINAHKHHLPWPVGGSVIARWAPAAQPPVRGLGFSTPDGENVRSVFWGKVVHNDTLRGFGRVVIIYHGHDIYSLYAFLADSTVRTGQEVEKDEPIGTAGFYPRAQGPGIYFELRFRQKPINPRQWLTAAR